MFYSFIVHCNLYSSTALQVWLNNRVAPRRELTVYILAVKLLITCTKYDSSMIQECKADLGHKLGQACNMQVTPVTCRPRPDITFLIFFLQIKHHLNKNAYQHCFAPMKSHENSFIINMLVLRTDLCF